MKHLNTLLLCGLALTLGMVGCDDVDGECESGMCDMGAPGGTGGGGGGMGGTPVEDTVYDKVIVVDDSSEENGAGTPGVDICGMTATCAGSTVQGSSADLSEGGGELCNAIGDGCSAVRSDATAALDNGSACEGGSDPSDYVSLGMAGTLIVTFDQDLHGCSIDVVELVGNDAEAFDVYVCADAGLADCISEGTSLGHSEGGDIQVDVPAE